MSPLRGLGLYLITFVIVMSALRAWVVFFIRFLVGVHLRNNFTFKSNDNPNKTPPVPEWLISSCWRPSQQDVWSWTRMIRAISRTYKRVKSLTKTISTSTKIFSNALFLSCSSFHNLCHLFCPKCDLLLFVVCVFPNCICDQWNTPLDQHLFWSDR